MTIAVRQATTADAAVVSALNAEVQALHAAALPWRFKPQGPDTFPPAAARALLAQPENLIFVAEIDQAPVGYAYAEVIRRPETAMTYAHAVVYLHHLGVQAARRRQGIGGALVERVHAAAKQRGSNASAPTSGPSTRTPAPFSAALGLRLITRECGWGSSELPLRTPSPP
jgi:ribosomal protein S18 acetylase RimI-like enzyme